MSAAGYRPQSQVHGRHPSQVPSIYARPGSVPYGAHLPTSPKSPWNRAHDPPPPLQHQYQYAKIPQPLPPPPPGPPPAIANTYGPAGYGYGFGQAQTDLEPGYGQRPHQPPQIPQPYNQPTSPLPPPPRPQSQAPLDHSPPPHGSSLTHAPIQDQSPGGAYWRNPSHEGQTWAHDSADPSEDLYSPPLPPRPALQAHGGSNNPLEGSLDAHGDLRQRRYSQAPQPPPKPVSYAKPLHIHEGPASGSDVAPPSTSHGLQDGSGTEYPRQRTPSRQRPFRTSTNESPVSPLHSQENVILDRPVSAIGGASAGPVPVPLTTRAAQTGDRSSAFALSSDWEHFGSGAYEIDDTAMYGVKDDESGDNVATVELPADSSTSIQTNGHIGTGLDKEASSGNVMPSETAPAQHGTPYPPTQVASSSGSESSRRKPLLSGGLNEPTASSQRRHAQSSSSPARQQSKRASNAAVASIIVEDAYQSLERPPSRGRPASDIRKSSPQPHDPAPGESVPYEGTTSVNRAGETSPVTSTRQAAVIIPMGSRAAPQDPHLEQARKELEELKARLTEAESAVVKAQSESTELASEVEQKDFLLSAKDAEIEMLQRSTQDTDLQRKFDEICGSYAALQESSLRFDAELKQAIVDKETMASKLQLTEAARGGLSDGRNDSAGPESLAHEAKTAELELKFNEALTAKSKIEQDLRNAASINDDLSEKLQQCQDQLAAFEAASSSDKDRSAGVEKVISATDLPPSLRDSLTRYKDTMYAESKITSVEGKNQLFLEFVRAEAEMRGINFSSDAKKQFSQPNPFTMAASKGAEASVAETDRAAAEDTDDGLQYSPGGRPILSNAWTRPRPTSGSTVSQATLAQGPKSSSEPVPAQATSKGISADPTSRRVEIQAVENLSECLSQAGPLPSLVARVSELSADLIQADAKYDAKALTQNWEAEASIIRSKLEKERMQRQTEVEKRNNELFDRGEIGYGDFGTLESQAKEEEMGSKEEEDKREFDSYVKKVFDMAYRHCSDELQRLSDLQHDIEAVIEECKDGQGLSGAIGLFMRCCDAVEKLHSELATTVLERDRRYRLTQTKPLYARGDVAGMKRVERAFEDAEKKSELKSLVERTERCKRAWKIIGAHMRRSLKNGAEYCSNLLAAVEEAVKDGKEQQRLAQYEFQGLLRRARDAVTSVYDDNSSTVKTFGLIDMALNNCEYDVSVASAHLKGKDEDFFRDLELEKKKEDAKLAVENDQRVKSLEDQKRKAMGRLVEVTKELDEAAEVEDE